MRATSDSPVSHRELQTTLVCKTDSYQQKASAQHNKEKKRVQSDRSVILSRIVESISGTHHIAAEEVFFLESSFHHG